MPALSNNNRLSLFVVLALATITSFYFSRIANALIGLACTIYVINVLQELLNAPKPHPGSPQDTTPRNTPNNDAGKEAENNEDDDDENPDDDEERIEVTVEKIPVSPARRAAEKRRVAYHEAGHTVVGHMLPYMVPNLGVRLPDDEDADMAGYNKHAAPLPGESTKNVILADIICNMGGIAAEELFYGGMSKNSFDDIAQATHRATQFITEYGMGELGIRAIDLETCSETLKTKVEDAVHKILTDAHAQAQTLAKEHKVLIERIALHLLENQELSPEEIIEILGPKPPQIATDLPTDNTAQ